jgi:putative ABC transport system ATP-binding protein
LGQLPVAFNQVTKTFKQGDESIVVLQRVTLNFAPGEFVSLMGPSGSGKSSLLNLIAGLDDPTEGTVKIGDFEPARASDSELCKWRSRNVGFIFQRYHLLGVLNAFQNVEIPLLLLKLPKAERQRRVRTALELVGLAQREKHLPKQLSGGQEQRVAIARCIVADPSIILADEPTGDLDAKSAAEVLDLLTLLNQKLGKTIIMVTHDPKAAQRATRQLRLDKGSIS